ncbi:MAG: CAP domain-containing protein [Chitinophagales bacterium]|nr:CAP domain-containing protein [Chitinophagaceae bacterium]MCB9064440.1 CAP domain-containing protein [Chitinophagales bacterium]
MRQPILAFALFAFVSFSVSCTKTDSSTTPSTPTTTTGTTPVTPNQQKLLDLVNEKRSTGCQCGAKFFAATTALQWNSKLEAAAQKHSDYMKSTGNFSHTGSGGSNAGQRITDEGYTWSTYGENIAESYTSEEAVIQGWIESTGHCENIMNPAFTEMGVATSGSYWTQVFAAPQ